MAKALAALRKLRSFAEGSANALNRPITAFPDWSHERADCANARLIALDEKGVTFKWKDYRIKGRDRLKTMTLGAGEFIRRFLLHVVPSGFHRIRQLEVTGANFRAEGESQARKSMI